MIEESKFENVLQSLRVRKGKAWTQAKTANELGVSVRTYKGWENGERIPDHRVLKNIAALFSLDTEAEAELYLAASQAPPKVHNLPFPRNPLFTGRDTYLELLDRHFKAGNSVALTQSLSISGLGGIGKTQLALEYAYSHYLKMYRAVFWVNAADEATLQESYNNIAQLLELQGRNERELDQRVLVKQWLERHTNWLLIMDNADNLQLARAFFPKTDKGHILLTTRSQIVSDVDATQIDIEKMEPEEGLIFLLRRSLPRLRKLPVDAVLDSVSSDIRETALEVVKLLDGHPLALDQAGAYIADGSSHTEYIHRYREELWHLLNEHGSLDVEYEGKYSQHPETVIATFDLCFQKARKRHPLAADLLYFCAFLQPDTIPDELFQNDDSFMLDTTALRSAKTALLRYSLIKRNTQEKTFSMHHLVQAVLTDDLSSDLQKQWRERVVRALNAAFPKNSFVLRRQRWQTERFLPHILLCAMWTDDELPPTAEIADFFDRVSAFCFEQRLLSAAELLLERIFSICERYLGVEHPITVSVQSSLADSYRYQGKYKQAKALFQYVLNILEQRLGATHPLTQETKGDYEEFLRSIEHDAEAAVLEANDEPSE